MTGRILIVDDEEGIRFTLNRFLSEEGHRISLAWNCEEAIELMDSTPFDVVFTDIVLGGRTGVDLLRVVRECMPLCRVVLITGYPEVDTAAEAVRLGAFDYLPKPVTQAMVVEVARRAMEDKARLERDENERNCARSILQNARSGLLKFEGEERTLEGDIAAPGICSLAEDSAGKGLEDAADVCGAECREPVSPTLEKQTVDVAVLPPLDGCVGPGGAVMTVRTLRGTKSAGADRPLPVGPAGMVGTSDAMRRVYGLIEALRDVPTTVLVTGESGTGKELVAEALARGGERGSKPFVKVNCAALSDGLLESELFGHVKGAFTGAVRDRAGRFQLAESGTIFLDEIGNISPRMQLGLLRVLQEGEFERVGDATPLRVDVRVIAATNQNLREKVESGEFRQDLYYRLKVVEVVMPPLRDRREDIPLLVEHFLQKISARFGRPVPEVSEDTLRLLMAYSWPGNVRELEHAVEHAVVLSREDVITLAHLPPEMVNGAAAGETVRITAEEGGGFTRQVVLDALRRSAWNKARAARMLGVSQRTIYRKIKKFNLSAH